MRVVLVGSTAERARLRAQLDHHSIEIVGEFTSMTAADGSAVPADAILVARRHGDGTSALIEPLTAREVQVLELMAEGLSNKGIAARLGISDQTVKFHVAAISGKLEAANRTDAVRRAVRQGLITL